ncbi:MAG: HD domain-containing protein [Syntrophales bacterium]|nr:HD domain-containing protein [Syntrophales bacterium]
MNRPLRVLLVEDVEEDAYLILRQLRQGGYDPVWERVDTPEALAECLRREAWDVVLCDYHLPCFVGFQALQMIREGAGDIPVVIVSGAIGEDKAVEAMRAGANDYVMKDNLLRLVPALVRELTEAESRRRRRASEEEAAKVEAHLTALMNSTDDWIWSVDAHHYRMLFFNRSLAQYFAHWGITLKEGMAPEDLLPPHRVEWWKDFYRQAVAEGPFQREYRTVRGKRLLSLSFHPVHRNGEIFAVAVFGRDITEREENYHRLNKALEGTIQAIASVVERRDPYTAGHQRRVAELATAIAVRMGLTAAQIEGLRMAAAIHDIGKIFVPAEILSMPRLLTDIEMGLVRLHPHSGFAILKDIEFPRPVAHTILEHHERRDGSGYPRGIGGEDIRIEARILAVADVVEAMSSHRPYRPARGIDEALKEITDNGGRLYEPAVVEACLDIFQNGGFRFC